MLKLNVFAVLAFVLLSGCMMMHLPSSPPSSSGQLTSSGQLNQTVQEGLDKLAAAMTSSMSQNKKTRIAVIEFSDLNGRVTNLGRFVAEELTTRLFATGRFSVIERNLINKIIQEQQLSMTGIVDAKTAIRAGAVLGADTIATGTITDLGNIFRINARMIETETGSVFAAAFTDLPKNDQLMKLQESAVSPKAAASGVDAFNITGTWKFVCCSGKYWGEAELTQDGSKIQGQWYDMARKEK